MTKEWQKLFLETGTENGFGDLSLLISTVSNIIQSKLASQREEIRGKREQLAELEHKQWIAWSKNIAETETLNPERLKRWMKLWRPYSELTEAEKDQDREWADTALSILQEMEEKDGD